MAAASPPRLPVQRWARHRRDACPRDLSLQPACQGRIVVEDQHGRSDLLGRRGGRSAFDVQRHLGAALGTIDDDPASRQDLSVRDQRRQRLSQEPMDRALQLARAVFGLAPFSSRSWRAGSLTSMSNERSPSRVLTCFCRSAMCSSRICDSAAASSG